MSNREVRIQILHKNSFVSSPNVCVVFASFLQYIFQELGMTEGDDQLAAPSKEQLEQEKQLLLAFKPVMQKFLHDHAELQVSALYALQVHCNASSFPKGTVDLFLFFFDNSVYI